VVGQPRPSQLHLTHRSSCLCSHLPTQHARPQYCLVSSSSALSTCLPYSRFFPVAFQHLCSPAPTSFPITLPFNSGLHPAIAHRCSLASQVQDLLLFAIVQLMRILLHDDATFSVFFIRQGIDAHGSRHRHLHISSFENLGLKSIVSSTTSFLADRRNAGRCSVLSPIIQTALPLSHRRQ